LQVLQDCKVLAPVPSYEEWKTVFNCANKYEVEYIECANDYEDVKKENQQLKALLKEWMHFYPIILYEHEDTLKTKDIIELYDKTTNAIG
jgi:hypothetical protein